MMLLGYLFGVPSERRLVKEIQVNVAYRRFLRMGLTEEVPDASPLSQNRICSAAIFFARIYWGFCTR